MPSGTMTEIKHSAPLAHFLAQPNSQDVNGILSTKKRPGPFEIIFLLRPNPANGVEQELARILKEPPRYHPPLDPEAFNQKVSASHEEVDAVVQYYTGQGLALVEKNATRRFVKMNGTLLQIQKVFQVHLMAFSIKEDNFFGHTQGITIPDHLKDVILYILGLNNFPSASGPGWTRGVSIHEPRDIMEPRYTPQQLATLYRFPKKFNGTGMKQGVIRIGGGFHFENIQRYFEHIGMEMPEINVYGPNCPVPEEELTAGIIKYWTTGQFGDTAFLGTWESTMDVELAGAMANGSHLSVYFPKSNANSKAGSELLAWETITCLEEDTSFSAAPASGSWGFWGVSPAYERCMNLQIGMLSIYRGITFCFSSHDFGSQGEPKTDAKSVVGATTKKELPPKVQAALKNITQNLPPGSSKPAEAPKKRQALSDYDFIVSFPALSPFSLAVGGTRLDSINDVDISDETVWNQYFKGNYFATGGGVSKVFPLPYYQKDADVPKAPNGKDGRGIPDVACVADLETGCEVMIGAVICPAGGTSASAPIWAALLSRIYQGLGYGLGHINPWVYLPNVNKTLNRISQGCNHFQGQLPEYIAKDYWNACAGWGSPDGEALLQAFEAMNIPIAYKEK